MQEAEVAPDPQLMESMRAVGYTLETAIADVVDNSITAQASRVDIHFSAAPIPYIAILDTGTGMSPEELHEAMRLAGKSPTGIRAADDLGRFGLGLKTASLSQCRTLTVVSKQRGAVQGVRWSLDHLAATGRWALLILSDDDLAQVPEVSRLNTASSGTLVVWTDLDQIHALPDQLERQMDDEMARVRDHLALVFHRFIGQSNKKFMLRLNGADVPTIDPFLRDHRATQTSTPETLTVAGEPVSLESYTLPYVSKLTQSERQRAQIAGTLRDSQGFYIYRAKRLVIWGTWFRIVPKDDLGKLARVRVDIPNSLDHLWSLDIKKSTAVPPPEVRAALRRLAGRFVHPSKTTHMYRGRPAQTNDPVDRLWTLIEERGSFRYEINRNHPAISVLSGDLDSESMRTLDRLLGSIESSFPVEDAYNRLGSDAHHQPSKVDEDALAELAARMWSVQPPGGASLEDFAARLASVEPFSAIPDVLKFLRKVLV